MKAIAQYFRVTQSIMPSFKVWMKLQCVTIEMKAAEYFHVTLLTMLYKVHGPSFFSKSAIETPVCNRSNKSYRAVRSRDTAYYAVEGGSAF